MGSEMCIRDRSGTGDITFYAALIEGRVDAAWGRWVRPWTLAAWLFLTIGIALGSWFLIVILFPSKEPCKGGIFGKTQRAPQYLEDLASRVDGDDIVIVCILRQLHHDVFYIL